MNAPEHVTPTADTPYTRRARYFSDDNGFSFRWSPVPVRQFLTERDRAFDPNTPTGMIALDSSDTLGTHYPATTPALLLRYIKIRAGEELRASLAGLAAKLNLIEGIADVLLRQQNIAGLWCPNTKTHWLCLKADLFSVHHRSGNAVELRGVAKARGDQSRVCGRVPAEKARCPEFQIGTGR